ncbi:MAG: DNA gyrase/topoisomerase IV subunit A, partial [Flavobacterium sp.]
DMIVLEKWNPNKPVSAIYFDGEKSKYYGKRFLIENENKEEVFISENDKSTLEIVSTDWRPVFEIEFSKVKGVQKENLTLDFEQFIAVKGIKALGNQITSDKIKAINALEPLPFEETVEEAPENMVDTITDDVSNIPTDLDEDGQITLSLE